jgi:mycofactocin precursor
MNEADSTTVTPDRSVESPSPDDLVEADALIEEVSIDGMCGVY